MGSASVAVAVAAAALLGAALWGGVRWALGRAEMLRPAGTESIEPRVARVFRSEALAQFAALAVGAGAAGALCLIGAMWRQGFGLGYALAGSVGAIAGLLAYALWPRSSWHTPGNGHFVADLSPRTPTSFARQWVFLLPLASAIALIAGLLWTGVYSATDEQGLHRVFQRRGLSGWSVENGQVADLQYNLSSSAPFPGWYYGVPVIVCTILLIATVYWSLQRVAGVARPADIGLFKSDDALRASRTIFVMAAAGAALALQIAGLAAVTGTVLRASYRDPIPTPNLDSAAATVPVEPGATLALAVLLTSLAIAGVAVILLIKALSTAIALWSSRPGFLEQVPVQ